MVAWDIVMVTPRSGWRAGKGCTEGPMRLVAWPKIHSVPTGFPQPDAGHSRMRDHESPRQWEWWRRIALLMSSPQVVARHTIAHTRGVKSRRIKGLWRFCMHQLCMVASGWWICCRCIWHDFTWFNVWIWTAYAYAWLNGWWNSSVNGWCNMIQHDVSLTPHGGPDGLVRCGIAVPGGGFPRQCWSQVREASGQQWDAFCLHMGMSENGVYP